VSEVAFVGSSLLEGCSGHNLAEAAVAGCAVLMGEHAGHFGTMADELNQAAVSVDGGVLGGGGVLGLRAAGQL
jgi:3-deoxy-D-manno-octulosonic-acid transferase